MPANWRSDWRNAYVDLTLDEEDDDEDLPPLPTVQLPSASRQPQDSTPRAIATHAHVPLPATTERIWRNGLSTSSVTSHQSTAATTFGNGASQAAHVPMHGSTHEGTSDPRHTEQLAKRRKITVEGNQTHEDASIWSQASINGDAAGPLQHAHINRVRDAVGNTTVYAHPEPALTRHMKKSLPAAMLNKAPSVQNMNAALKTSGSITSLLGEVAGSGPRPIQIGRRTDAGDSDISSPRSDITVAKLFPMNNLPSPSTSGNAHPPHQAISTTTIDSSNREDDDSVMSDSSVFSDVQPHSGKQAARWHRRHGDEDGHLSDAVDTCNSVLSDVSVQNDKEPRLSAHLPRIASAKASPRPAIQQAVRQKFTNQFSEEEEHLLIFLKEVKKLQWKLITSEFQRYYPTRAYHTLQSRYTTNINKRNRDEDPATLKLPSEWASEATIDWPSVRAAQPLKPAARGGPSRDAAQVSTRTSTPEISKPSMVRQPTENDYSSGGDVSMHVRRPRRAPLVNYDVRRRNKRLVDDMSEMDLDDGNSERPAIVDTSARSTSPQAQLVAPVKAHVVINSPLQLDHDATDAAIALRCRKSKGDKLPYLGLTERLSLQNTPDSWEWDQLVSRSWQGMLVHVDFSPEEIAHVERALAANERRIEKPRHSTQRRQLQLMLKLLTEPRLLRIAHDLQRRLPARSSDSIAAFLRDTRAGKLPETPQILRLSAARPQRSMITCPNESTSTILRQRELGLQSRRGWKAASRTLTFPVKNKVMDTLGPASYWTGASGDIHTVAWSPDGESFAAGAVAVTDQDSMQYNRPNNLLFGSLAYNEIHELPCHSLARPITTTGANSSLAMFASQDPKLYTTVTSVAFAPCGSLMYSAGYDKSLCVWDVESPTSQPQLALKLRRGEEVEMMAVHPHESGVLAIASRKIDKAIRLVRLGEQYPRGFDVHSFQSEKATSRSELKILPQALRFEPRFGSLLLAGFGANVREDSRPDITGDLCLWDIETHAQMSIHGSNKNVFDVAFNPNQRSMPLFAAGCVAGGNVNRGMRSVIRLFEHRTMDRYTSPVEIECRALDMNDVVWCPHDEHLIAAGCTDGRVYLWDLRNYHDPLRVLSHGPSLMPLQEGVPHERTDTGIRFLSWGDNATRLYSGSSDGVVKAWDVTRSVEDTFIKDLITADSGIMAGAFSPDFSKLLIGEVNGSVDVLEVGRDDCTIKDTTKLRYVPYHGDEESETNDNGDSVKRPNMSTSGFTEREDILQNGELQLAPMGNLPIRQVVQGPNYSGPYNHSIEAPALRQQALDFQIGLSTPSTTHCDIASCKEALVRVNSEEFGDSGRSLDRIPDELRKQWSLDTATSIIPGRTKCANCGRPALPSSIASGSNGAALCERCCFACFRCGSFTAVTPDTTTVMCDSCKGVWEAGALGFECVEQPTLRGTRLDVPPLRRFGRDILEDYTTEDSTFGDEMNALTDYYLSLAIDRSNSPL